MTITCKNCGAMLTTRQAGEPCPICGNMDRNLFDQDEAVFTEKGQAARELANKHYEVETGLTRVFRISGSAEVEVKVNEPIKLLEVNENTVPSGVLPLHFGPAPASGIPFPSIIIEVTPEEFEKIQSEELKLPAGWKLGEEIQRPADVNGAA